MAIPAELLDQVVTMTAEEVPAVCPSLKKTIIERAMRAEVSAWQSRPLEPMYPVIFFDALQVKISEDAMVRNKAVYPALGALPEGTCDVLGIWIEQTEGANVGFLDYDLGHFDEERGQVEPNPNPFVPDKVLIIGPEQGVTHVTGIHPDFQGAGESTRTTDLLITNRLSTQSEKSQYSHNSKGGYKARTRFLRRIEGLKNKCLFLSHKLANGAISEHGSLRYTRFRSIHSICVQGGYNFVPVDKRL